MRYNLRVLRSLPPLDFYAYFSTDFHFYKLYPPTFTQIDLILRDIYISFNNYPHSPIHIPTYRRIHSYPQLTYTVIHTYTVIRIYLACNRLLTLIHTYAPAQSCFSHPNFAHTHSLAQTCPSHRNFAHTHSLTMITNRIYFGLHLTYIYTPTNSHTLRNNSFTRAHT